MDRVMKALVTGSTGFIGSHLVETLLERGHEVTTLDRTANDSPRITRAFRADILDAEKVREATAGQDIVYHLSALLGTAELIAQAHHAVDVNINGTVNVLDACRSEDAALLFVSKPNPWLNTYSITKQAAEQFCLMYRSEFAVPVTIVKPFNVYGPRESVGPGRAQKLISNTIAKALNDLPLTIFGTGNQINDYIYIDDVVRLITDLSTSDRAINGTYDVGTGTGQTVNEVCRLILELTGSNSEIERQPMRPGESSSAALRADLSQIERVMPVGEFMGLRDGLARTVEFCRSNMGSRDGGTS